MFLPFRFVRIHDQGPQLVMIRTGNTNCRYV
jgi:hypothetical protein